MKKIYSIGLIFNLSLISIITVSSAYASGFVIDVAAEANTLHTYQQLQSEYQELQQQYNELTNIKSTINTDINNEISQLTGHYGMGNLYDDAATQQGRLWSQDNWQDVLKIAAGGNYSRFNQLQQAYSQLYPTVDQSQIVPSDPNNVKAVYYTQSANTNRATLAASEYAYNQINDHMKAVENLLAQVEGNNNNDEKSAIDLNGRLVAEVAFIQLQELKLQAIQTQMQATQAQGQVNGMTMDASFVK